MRAAEKHIKLYATPRGGNPRRADAAQELTFLRSTAVDEPDVLKKTVRTW